MKKNLLFSKVIRSFAVVFRTLIFGGGMKLFIENEIIKVLTILNFITMRKNLLTILMLFAALVVPWASRAQCTAPTSVVIGDSTSTGTSYSTPVNTYYNYSLTETIIDADEIGGPMTINSISFYYQYTTALSAETSVTMWLQPTTKSVFSSSSDMEVRNLSTSVQIYSGTFNCTYGWNTITFTTPYNYDGLTNLMLIVDDNSGDYDGNSYVFKTSACTGNKTLHWYDDDEDPNPTSSSYDGYQAVLTSRVVMKLNGCDLATCHRATIDSVVYDATTATVYWEGGDASNYYVTLSQGDSVIDNAATTGTEMYYSTLDPNTVYTVKVYTLCPGNDTSAAASVTFRTECGAISTLPYQNDFENEPYYLSGTTTYAEAFPDCWTRINDATGTYNYYPYINTSSTYLIHGEKSMYWYHSTTASYANNEYAVLPPVDLDVYDIADLTLAFYAKTTATASPWPLFIVGVMDSANVASTFVPVDTITLNNTTPKLCVVNFANYTGNGAYIAIRCPRTTSARYASLDDIYLTDAWCDDLPANVTVSDVTANSVTVNWSTNGGSSFKVFLGSDTVTVNNDSSYTFTGLTPNTSYGYGVAGLCTGGAQSPFFGGSIRTECLALTTLPYSNDFEDGPYYLSGTTSYADAFPDCWHRINDATGTYNYYPYISTTSTYLIHGTKSMYWYHSTSSTYANNQYAVLPPVDLDVYNIADLTLSFYAKTTATASPYPQFIVGVMDNANVASTFVPVDTITLTTTPTLYVVNFANYTGNGAYIAIRSPRTSTSTTKYASLDDIYLTDDWCEVPTNVTVSDITTNSITVNWSTNGGSNFSVYLGTDTVTVSNDSSYTFTNLTPNTPYAFGVATVCTSDNSTYIVGNARTACAPIDSLPYVMNFNNALTGSANVFDPCWHVYNTYSSTANYPYVTSGYLYMYMYNSSGINSLYGYAMLPELDATLQATDLELTFDIWGSSTASYGGGVIVALFDSIPAASTTLPAFDTVAIIIPTGTSQATSTTHYVTFEGHNMIDKRIAFVFKNQKSGSPSYYYTYIDNVYLREAPTCLTPSNLTVNAAAADSVVVSWNDGHDNYAWQLAVGLVGFNPDTVNADSLISCYDSVQVLTNLLPAVAQQVYVRADCGGEYSYWIGPVTFTPGSIIMGVTGSATMNVCNAIVYDDGGPTGNYSSSCDYTLTLYPIDETKRLKFWGSGSTESCCDYLRIYAGTSASGTLLASMQGENLTIDTVSTQGGPITLYFHSDGSVVKTGFAINIACEDLPPCRDVIDVTVVEASTSSAYITWENAVGTTPLPNEYIVTVTDTAGNTVSTLTTTNMFALMGGMTANTDYTVSVVPSCDESNGMAATATFTSAAFPCVLFDTTGAGVPYQVGDGTGTSYYLPIGNFYKYSYTQQLFEASEMNGPMPITGIDFEYGYTSPTTSKTDVTIYLAHTTVSSLSSSFVAYNASTFVPVYHGNLNATNGWNHYAFDTVFNYDGVSNLLVVIHDNSNAYNGSSYVFKTHPATGKGRYVQNDSNPYTLSSISLTGGSSVTYRANTKFGTYSCAQSASCAAPLMVVTGKTDSSVSVIWAAGANETAWNVEHKASTDSVWTVDLTGTTTTSLTINGLASNTHYDIRVYHVCSGDTLASVRGVTTDCAGAAVPFAENFSTWATGTTAAIPGCWFKGSDYSAGYPYVSTTGMGDGKSMYFYASATTYTYLALPKMAAPMDTLVVTGYVYYSTSNYHMNIGVMTDAEDFSTFHTAGGVATVANTWVPFEVILNGMPEGNIAFHVGNSGAAYAYLDNIEVNYYNPCVRPTNVTVNHITTNSANVHWVDTATTNFEIEYGPAGFAHGEGITVTSDVDTVELTGLLHSTMYEVYVRGICGVGDTGSWSFVSRFATLCAPIDVLPMVENFENWGTGTSVHAPNCWTYGSNYSTTYPYISTNTTHGGCMYMYDGSSAGSANKTWFALPELSSSVAAVNQTQVIFSVYSSTTSYQHPVMVGVGNHSTLDTTIMWLDTIIPTYGEWTEHEVSLENYTGSGHFIFFATHVAGSYAYSYPYVDDITLELIPSCRRPDSLNASNATPTTVDLSWIERSGATKWQIEYGPAGFTPGTGTLVPANANPFTLTGLPVAYQGEFRVRSICSTTDTGDFSRHLCGFATSQIPATLPYNYDFENGAEWDNWQVSSNNPNVNWFRGSAVADSSSYSLYVSADSGATYKPYLHNAITNAAAYRDIDFGPVDSSYTLSFRARVGGTIENYYDGLMVFLVDPSLSTVPSNSSITSPWGNVNDLYRIATVRLDTTWQTYEASFDTISGIHRVAFFWFNQNTSDANLGEPAAVDNIHIAYSTCPRPVALDTVVVGSSAAVLTWQGASSANYEVVYRIDGGTNQVTYTNTNSVTLTGLNSATTYRAWVRKICGVGDTSLWSDGIKFDTKLCDGAQVVATGDESTTTTSYLTPLNNFYKYTLTETIIDSAELGGAMDISSLAYYYNYSTAMSSKTNVTIYLQPTDKSVFSSTTDVVALDTTIAVKVYQGNLNCTQGWNYFSFIDNYHYNGHGNLLVIVDDNSNAYNGSAYVFKSVNCTGSKTLVYYSDSYDPDVTDPSSYSGTKATYQYRALMQLISCGGGNCDVPLVMGSTPEETSITVTVATADSSAAALEAVITDQPWSDAIATTLTPISINYPTENTFTFNGLTALTNYTVAVRTRCGASTVSDWVPVAVTTLRHPCYQPTAVTVTNETYDGATVSWTIGEEETSWEVNVHSNSPYYDTNYIVNTTPTLTVTGLDNGNTYTVTVRALCFSDWYSDWTAPKNLTTVTCPTVSDVTSSNVTANSATITWTDNGAVKYEVEYGTMGFQTGTGTMVPTTTNSLTLTGLEEQTVYDVFVRGYCTETVHSGWSTKHRFTTAAGSTGIADVENGLVTLFPNPASSVVTIAGLEGESIVTVVDLNGREVFKGHATGSLTLDVTGYAKGAYFVRVTGESTTAIRKLIVR